MKNYELFFDTWSNNLAYILGFIAADGCLRSIKQIKKGREYFCKSVKIALAIEDICHLEKIRQVIGYPRTIKIYNNGKSGFCPDGKHCELSIYSQYITDKIVNLGIGYRKSLVLEWPQIPPEFNKSFIRGYLDGDGCIYQYKNGSTQCLEISFAGTLNFLTKIKSIIPINAGYIKQSKNIYYLIYRGSNTPVFVGNYIYSSAGLRLERKYNRYIKYLESYYSKTNSVT